MLLLYHKKHYEKSLFLGKIVFFPAPAMDGTGGVKVPLYGGVARSAGVGPPLSLRANAVKCGNPVIKPNKTGFYLGVASAKTDAAVVTLPRNDKAE